MGSTLVRGTRSACARLQGGLGSAGLVRGGVNQKDNGLPKNGKRRDMTRLVAVVLAVHDFQSEDRSTRAGGAGF